MRILVVGDAILDEFILCEPGTSSGGEPILLERERVYRPGGAAAVAMVAESLGAEVRLFTSLADAEPVITRIRCAGRDDLRIDSAGAIRQGACPVRDDILHADAVIVADYAKGALDTQERQRIIRLCNALGVPCVVGAARGVAWSEYAGATVISATQTEAWAAGYPQAHRAPLYCLTADRLGLRIIDPSGASHRARYTVAEVDALGCGDSVCAALAVGLAERMPLDALSSFAAAVGAIQASRGPGIQPVSRAEADSLADSAAPA